MPLDDPTEIFHQVTENDTSIGQVSRKLAHSNKQIIHRSIGILITNENDDEILMHQRSLSKDTGPGTWSYGVGGHVNFGESYLETAVRELKEEMGITKNNLKLIKSLLVKTSNETEFNHLFQVKIDKITPIIPDKDEVSQLKWVKKVDLELFIKTHVMSEWAITTLRTLNLIS